MHCLKDDLEVEVRWQLLEVDAADEFPGEGHQALEVVHV